MKKTTAILKKFLLLILSMGFTQAYSQLSGSYTINAAVAANSTNYKSFAAAIFDLTDITTGTRPDAGPRNGPGVSGPVLFNIANGIYDERNTLNAVSGSSSANTITFQGQDSAKTELTSTDPFGDNHTLKLNGAQYIRFKKMSISTNRNSNSYALYLAAGSNNNEISNCYFKGSKLANGYLDWGVVYIFNSALCTISNCRIAEGGCGIDLNGGTYQNGNRILNNIITNTSGNNVAGISADHQTDLLILNNSIVGHRTGFTMVGGTNFEIEGNTIYASSAGLWIYTLSGGRLVNNFISARQPITCQSLGDMKIYHNTLTGGSPLNGVLDAMGIGNCHIANNIFHATEGPVFTFGFQNTMDASNTVEHNNYSTVGKGYMALIGTVKVFSLTDLQNAPPYSLHQNCDTSERSFLLLPQSNPFKGDLHLISFTGVPLGDTSVHVPYDIDGELRCLPYVGADGLPAGSGFPVAFFAAPDSVELNDTLLFTADTSGNGGPNLYSWDIFNDGSNEFFGMYAGWLFSVPGTYEIKLTAENCSGFISIVRTIVVKDSISSPPLYIGSPAGSRNDNLLISPNPSDGIFNVTLRGYLKYERVMVFNYSGVMILDRPEGRKNTSFEVDLSREPAGMYFIRVKTDEGIVSKKVLLLK